MLYQYRTISFFILITLLLPRSPGFTASGAIEDLYSDADDVIKLDSRNFNSTVFRPNNNVAHMVEFYNTYCGHCQNFAPIYKGLASRVKNWTSVIKVAGVDCFRDENIELCSDGDIKAYPTILFYPPGAKHNNPADRPFDLRQVTYDWTIDGLEEAIVDYLYNITSERPNFPQPLKALRPIDVDHPKELERIHPNYTDHDEVMSDHHTPDFFIIIESKDSYLGRRLIIEYIRIRSRVEIRRVVAGENNRFIEALIGGELSKIDESQPILVQLSGENFNQFHTNIMVRGQFKSTLPTSETFERIDACYNKLKNFIENRYSTELKYSIRHHTPSIPNKTNLGPDFDEPELTSIDLEMIGKNRIFAVDILKAISYMLTHEIPIKGRLSPEDFTTVRQILTILRKYLPIRSWDSQLDSFVSQLRTRLDEKRDLFERDGVQVQEMRDILTLSGADSIRSKYQKKRWITCDKSYKNKKGYTCSLWILFHSLTAGEYLKAAPVKFRPALVLFTMRDYIIKFLGCSVCAENFKKETIGLASELKYRNSSLIWLWSTHNRVNERLNNENQEFKRELLDVIYPNSSDCLSCYDSDPKTNTFSSLKDISWNISSIVDHLILVYRPDHVVTSKDLNAVLDHSNKTSTTADVTDQADQGSLFSTSDFSLSLLIYLVSIIIVAIVCLALNPRWKRCKTK